MGLIISITILRPVLSHRRLVLNMRATNAEGLDVQFEFTTRHHVDMSLSRAFHMIRITLIWRAARPWQESVPTLSGDSPALVVATEFGISISVFGPEAFVSFVCIYSAAAASGAVPIVMLRRE